MIRVLQFGMSFNRGGIETFLFNYYKHMDHKEVQFDFVKSGSNKIPFEDEIKAMGGNVYEFRPCGIKKGYYRNRKQWLDFFEKTKPDVIHYNTIALTSLYALKYSKEFGIQMRIAHVHPNTYSKDMSIKGRFFCKINKYLVERYATNCWSCSKEAGNWAFRKDFDVVPNAIELERFAFVETQREEVRRALQIQRSIVICNVGNLSNVKNQTFLVDIMAELRKGQQDVVLLILGDGICKKHLEEKAVDLGVRENIYFLGNVKDVEKYLSASDIFVFPSKSEGFGIVLLEAQANGLPCIASADVIPRETNVTGGVKFVSLEGSPAYWAEQIVQTLPSGRLPSNKIDSLQEKYNLRRCANNLQRLYAKGLDE